MFSSGRTKRIHHTPSCECCKIHRRVFTGQGGIHILRFVDHYLVNTYIHIIITNRIFNEQFQGTICILPS
jgi:hypothetical protein